jgi:hypothetical protein
MTWHKLETTDDYPDRDGEYLVLLPHDEMLVARFEDWGDKEGDCEFIGFEDLTLDEVEYWRELPEKPS